MDLTHSYRRKVPSQIPASAAMIPTNIHGIRNSRMEAIRIYILLVCLHDRSTKFVKLFGSYLPVDMPCTTLTFPS